jgi:amino-acid N-acetyltransferase
LLDSTSSPSDRPFPSYHRPPTACFGTAHGRKPSSSAKERQRAERDQLTRLLKESPGKRDARNFLKHFDTPKKRPSGGPTKANAPTVFSREPLPDAQFQENEEDEPLHLALIKLRQPQALDDATLGGIALTLSQLAQLGLSTAVVLDCDSDTHPSLQSDATTYGDTVREQADTIREQAARLVAALKDYHEPGALLVEHALAYSNFQNEIPNTVQVRGDVEVKDDYLLFPPINDGMIPVIPPFAYQTDLKKVRVSADDVLLALIRDFAGISGQTRSSESEISAESQYELPILDRIIILDPLGGIPSQNRADGAHVFVNLEAEYRDIKQELASLTLATQADQDIGGSTSLGSSNPLSKFVEDEIAALPTSSTKQITDTLPSTRHSKNLDVVQRALKVLPPSSSGLIITPAEAATQALPPPDASGKTRTKPSKNPLIHNLITDKPMISSSLPTSPTNRSLGSATPNPPTFLKKGIPLTMIPDPRATGPWRPPSASNPSIDLANDPRINLPKLVDLINDSFRRRLDPQDYLDRIRGRVAGVIIAGDYEGGAICTWETPSTLTQTPLGSTADTPASSDSPYWVPYLDKFAVLTSSQGSGGVSDIVWAALVRTCFPEGVVWRSRTSNPVNKWYQERSTGMWNLPGDQWTMFWTTDGVTQGWDARSMQEETRSEQLRRWDAYVHVCSGIEPSWADSK